MDRHGAQHIYIENRSFEASSAWLKQLSIKPQVVEMRGGGGCRQPTMSKGG
jgi:hypothetical protein